jgi:uncharacterized membrane protein
VTSVCRPFQQPLEARDLRATCRSGASVAAAICLFVYAALPHAGIAQETQGLPQEPPSVWLYSLYKTITYETAANLADIPLYSTVLAGAQAGTTLFTGVNVVTAFAAYYVYEVGWNLYRPPLGESPTSAIKVEIEKTLLYRVVSSARNVALAYALTGSYAATFGFVVINNLTDTVLYVANEYGWYRYGPPVATVWGNGVSLQDIEAELLLEKPAAAP